ncbi:MAG: plastocyanin [Thiotrichales bacterium SG8_50]|jgi:plastocyanin domain-containing protein|nr:MAG: plastocyanin [Thiotrichales bacterium SG8_50]
MTAWLVNAAGIALIALIAWWFWLMKPAARRAEGGVVEVLVADGVYTPARIEVPSEQPVRLRFLRKDPSACAEKVIFADLGIAADLPLNQPVDLTVTPPRTGEFAFTCQMQMYRGALVAR